MDKYKRISLIFEDQLAHPDIVIPLTNPNTDQSPKENQQGKQQTAIYGIVSPLIQINNTVVDFIDVLEFSLKSTSVLPTVQCTVRDRMELINKLEQPGLDNEITIKILPPFDNAYKKIELSFYINSYKVNNNIITLTGSYKLPKLTSSRLKSLGEICTYDLCFNIAKETRLGFATNLERNDTDKRYIYCDNKSYVDILNREVRGGGTEIEILDYWVDLWNNLTLVDLYSRYKVVEKEEDMKIWVSMQTRESDKDIEITPVQVPATLTNSPLAKKSELYVTDYSVVNKTRAQMNSGTDRVYSIYEDGILEHKDYLIQDGDVKKDVFEKFEYVGEVYGGYNYFLANKKREALLQKIGNETIELVLNNPLLALNRGDKINFLFYMVNDRFNIKYKLLKERGLADNNPQTNLPIEDELKTVDDNEQMILDKSKSGQYTIIGCDMRFYNGEWKYKITASRPTEYKPKILKDDE